MHFQRWVTSILNLVLKHVVMNVQYKEGKWHYDTTRHNALCHNAPVTKSYKCMLLLWSMPVVSCPWNVTSDPRINKNFVIFTNFCNNSPANFNWESYPFCISFIWSLNYVTYILLTRPPVNHRRRRLCSVGPRFHFGQLSNKPTVIDSRKNGLTNIGDCIK